MNHLKNQYLCYEKDYDVVVYGCLDPDSLFRTAKRRETASVVEFDLSVAPGTDFLSVCLWWLDGQ